MKTCYDLLISAPFSQVERVGLAWRCLHQNEWGSAAAHLREAARLSEGQWSLDAAKLAEHCQRRA